MYLFLLIINITYFCYTVHKIWVRHNYLKRFIGTKDEEDDSMDAGFRVIIAFSICLLVSSVLEVIFYFIFNRFVCLCINYKSNEFLFNFSSIPG